MRSRLSVSRYLDFVKFIDLLDRRALYFSRADQMEEPWEGSLGPRGDGAN
jgi:hypothetical protein